MQAAVSSLLAIFESTRAAQPGPAGFNEWFVDQMLGKEPGLQFVGAQHIAHHQVVGAIVAKVVGSLG